MRSLGVALVLLCAGCGPVRRGPEPQVALPEVVTVPPQPTAHEPTITSGPFGAGQVWTGTFYCPPGETELRLIVLEAYEFGVRALFDFHHASSGARGTYLVEGAFGTKGKVLFRPVGWIARPAGYEMVGMSGVLSDDRITGRMTDEACGAFDVLLEPTRPSARGVDPESGYSAAPR